VSRSKLKLRTSGVVGITSAGGREGTSVIFSAGGREGTLFPFFPFFPGFEMPAPGTLGISNFGSILRLKRVRKNVIKTKPEKKKIIIIIPTTV